MCCSPVCWLTSRGRKSGEGSSGGWWEKMSQWRKEKEGRKETSSGRLSHGKGRRKVKKWRKGEYKLCHHACLAHMPSLRHTCLPYHACTPHNGVHFCGMPCNSKQLAIGMCMHVSGGEEMIKPMVEWRRRESSLLCVCHAIRLCAFYAFLCMYACSNHYCPSMANMCQWSTCSAFVVVGEGKDKCCRQHIPWQPAHLCLAWHCHHPACHLHCVAHAGCLYYSKTPSY